MGFLYDALSFKLWIPNFPDLAVKLLRWNFFDRSVYGLVSCTYVPSQPPARFCQFHHWDIYNGSFNEPKEFSKSFETDAQALLCCKVNYLSIFNYLLPVWVSSARLCFIYLFYFIFYVHFSTLLHLPPLRFHVEWCWNRRTQDCCDFGIDSRTLWPLG